jgi:hypothetical protein
MKPLFNKYILKVTAAIIVIISYALTAPNNPSRETRKKLGSSFNFEIETLFKLEGQGKLQRKVHPQYTDIVGWLSAAGAAVTITDIDNDGLYNDYIYVDPRFDKVILASANKKDTGFLPFTLDVNTLPYDAKTMAPQGTLTHDFNEDGLIDILVYYWGRTPIIFINTGKDYKETELTNNKERWFTLAATLADFDGDGHVDIFITNYFPDGSRLLDANATDKNQTMQHSMSRAYNGGKNHFFLYQGGAGILFKEDLGWHENINNPNDWTLAVGAVDLTNDLLPEIYLANDFGPDKLLLNESIPGKLKFKPLIGKRTFTSIASAQLGKDSFKGMGVGIGDLDNDGYTDFYISNIADEYALMESHFAFINTGNLNDFKKGIAPFENKSDLLGLARSSWGWDAKIADFNNDGIQEIIQATGFMKGTINKWPELQELAIGNDELIFTPKVWPKLGLGDDLSGHDHNPLFVKTKTGNYIDLAPEAGIAIPQVSRGVAVGDVDYDGDLDFFVANQWEDSFLFRNNHKASNDFFGLRLYRSLDPALKKIQLNPKVVLPKMAAVGAAVRLYDNETLIGSGFVDGGNGHSGSNSKDILIGIPNYHTKSNYTLEITYRCFSGTLINQKIKVSQGWNTLVLPY